jgi:hypothetical protein
VLVASCRSLTSFGMTICGLADAESSLQKREERGIRHPKIRGGVKIRVKGSGQECPLYMGFGGNALTLQ